MCLAPSSERKRYERETSGKRVSVSPTRFACYIASFNLHAFKTLACARARRCLLRIGLRRGALDDVVGMGSGPRWRRNDPASPGSRAGSPPAAGTKAACWPAARRVCKATAAEISLSLDQDREQSERGTTDYDKRTFAWREWRIGSPNRLCSNWPWAGIEGLSGEPDAKKEPGSSSQVLLVPS